MTGLLDPGVAAAVGGGLIVGILSGLLGIGGGVLLVPLLTLGFGLAQQTAQGTSLAAIIPTSIAGAVTHDRLGNVDRRAAAWMAVGSVLGTVAGAALAIHVSHALLARGFGILLVFTAWRLWARRDPPVGG